MTLPPARKLSRHVDVPVDDRRVDRIWSAIEARRSRESLLATRWPVLRWLPSVAAAGLALALGLVLARSRSVAPTMAGMVIEGEEHGSVTMTDGTRLVLQPAARLRWDRVDAERTEATLERGEVGLDVPHVASRTLVIHAGGFDIVDRGTRFVVSVAIGRVSVAVESGRVDVLRRGSSEPARALAAGESWTSALPMATSATASAEAPAPATEPGPATPSASSESAGPGVSPEPSASHEASARTAGPKELLEAANAARLAGRPRDAATAFDTLRRRYRTDSRAGLAAFELGRLRLDAFGDPRLAVEAFDDAIELAPNGAFREDAEARRVDALDAMHSARCPAARTAYLARYPNGLHAASVGARCAR